MTPEEMPLVSSYAAIIQVGSRSMQNFCLLEVAGKSSCSVFLKRHFSATLEEWLRTADYVLKQDNP